MTNCALKLLNRLYQKGTYRDGRRIFYLDIATHFYRGEKVYGEPTSGMTLTEDIMPDYLHLSTAGYHIWADSMSPILNRLLAGTNNHELCI